MRRKLLRRDTLPVKTTHEVVTHSISIFQNLCNFQCSISSTMFTMVQKDFVGFALNTNLFLSPCAPNTQKAECIPCLHGHAPSCHQEEIAWCQCPSFVYFWLELWPSVALQSNGVLSPRIVHCPSATKRNHQLTVDTPREPPGSLSDTFRICQTDSILKYLRSEKYKTRGFHIFSQHPTAGPSHQPYK